MTLFKQQRLAVSLPAVELARITIPASIFSVDQLDVHRLSVDLQAELDRIIATFSLSASDVFVVARPEMFTHGKTLEWLKSKITDVRDHLCFSDGSTFKVIPGHENHIYFFRPNAQASRHQFALTLHRAPELFASYSSQINSAYSTLAACGRQPPEPVLLQGRSRWREESAVFFPFYLDPSRMGHTFAYAKVAASKHPRAAHHSMATAVCLTDASLQQLAFVRYLARLILAVMFAPQRSLWLISPSLEFGGIASEERLSLVYTALAPHLGDLPRVQASNISVVMGSLENLLNAKCFGGAQSLLLPTSFGFWRCGADAFKGFSNVVMFPDALSFDVLAGDDLYTAAFGRSPCKAVLNDGYAPMSIPELEA